MRKRERERVQKVIRCPTLSLSYTYSSVEGHWKGHVGVMEECICKLVLKETVHEDTHTLTTAVTDLHNAGNDDHAETSMSD